MHITVTTSVRSSPPDMFSKYTVNPETETYHNKIHKATVINQHQCTVIYYVSAHVTYIMLTTNSS